MMFRPSDGSPCYVGKGSKGYRPSEHAKLARLGKHSNRHLMNLYKANGFFLPAAIIRSDLTEAEAFALEKALITAIGKFPKGPLTNITDGGEGASGLKLSEASIAQMREKKIGKKQSKELIERRASIARGKKRSEETRAKMRASQREAVKKRKDNAGVANPFYGKVHTEETRARLREVNRMQREANGGHGPRFGQSTSEEHRQKLRAAKIGKPLGEEHKEKLRQASLASWAKRQALRTEQKGTI